MPVAFIERSSNLNAMILVPSNDSSSSGKFAAGRSSSSRLQQQTSSTPMASSSTSTKSIHGVAVQHDFFVAEAFAALKGPQIARQISQLQQEVARTIADLKNTKAENHSRIASGEKKLRGLDANRKEALEAVHNLAEKV